MNAEIESVVGTNVMEEAFEELTGESKRKWGLVGLGFLLGVVAVTAVIRLILRRSTHTVGTQDADVNLTPSDATVTTSAPPTPS
jgi:hypothetical protein